MARLRTDVSDGCETALSGRLARSRRATTLLTVTPAEGLRQVVASTPAQPFLEPENAKMFGSIRSVTGSAIAALEYIQAQRTEAFSVRDWVRGGRGVLFIPYQAGQIAALRTVIAAWLRLGVVEAMSGQEGDQRL